MNSLFVVFFTLFYGGFFVGAMYLAYKRYKEWKIKEERKNRFKLIKGGKDEQN
jgi:hypothetical protein